MLSSASHLARLKSDTLAEWVTAGQATRLPENSLEAPHTQPAGAQSWTGLFRPSSDSSRAPALSSRADGLKRQMPGLPETRGYLKSSLNGTESTSVQTFLSQLH